MKKIATLLLLTFIFGCSQPKNNNEQIIIEPVLFESVFNTQLNAASELINVESVELDLKGNDLCDVSDQVVQYITLTIDSEDCRKVSNEINRAADNYLQELVFHPDDELYQGHWKTVSFFKINYWINDEILSIVTQNERYLYEAASGNPEYITYNIDIKNGHLLNNQELLEKLSLTSTDAAAFVNEYLIAANIKSCDDTENSASYCYFDRVFDNNSLLFYDGEKILLLLKLTYGISQPYVSIPLK